MLNPSAVLYGPRDVRIEDRPVPEPAASQVLVEIAAVGICGSDVHYYEHGRIGNYVVRDPMIIGHESAGTVVDIGDGVDRNRVGELVALEPGVPCRTCRQCLRGRYNLCPRVVFFATPPVDGSISHYVAIDADFAHSAPSGLTAEQAAMAEPVSVGIWAARKSAVAGGDRVLITGAGPIGLLAGQVARALGADTPVVTDVSGFRLARARDLGLRTAQAGTPLEEEFDVLLECSGAPAALTDGMRALAPAGRVALVGMGADTVTLNVALTQGRELSVTGVFRYANTYPLALQLISSGAVNVTDVITHRFTLQDTERALTISRTDPSSLKAMVYTAHRTQAVGGRHDTHAIGEELAMTGADDPHPMSPGMPPACGHKVRAEFDHLVMRDDFVADLSGNSGHRLLEFQPQVIINTKGQVELHLTVPGPDVWTSLLTAMAVIRQSGYAPIAVHVLDKPESRTIPVQASGNDSN